MTVIEDLLAANAKWAEEYGSSNPNFFAESAKGQAPKILWIGCADSRVPESVISGAKPGDIFVHRNIANQFHLDDDNVLSVLAYAVDHLGVEHVVIVGHTECGGAAACYKASIAPSYNPSAVSSDPLGRWLGPLTALAASLELSATAAGDAVPKVVEENVKLQVSNLSKTPVIVNAWANKSGKGRDVWIHGLVYDLSSGKLKDLGVTQGPK